MLSLRVSVTLSLGVKNPNIVEEIDERSPEDIISEIEELDKQSFETLKKLRNFYDVE